MYERMCTLTEQIDIISPGSSFTVVFTSATLAILVESVICCVTGRTPSTILNCKYAESFLQSCDSTLGKCVLASLITTIQDGICSFNGRNCTSSCVFETSKTLIVVC